jgi:hypothetical protein
VDTLKLSKKEMEQIDDGLAITFMHLKEILKNPASLDDYTNNTTFFPVYLKDREREALLIGVRPQRPSGKAAQGSS